MVGSAPRKLLLALACVLCCAALAPALASAAGTGSIHGTVTEKGTPTPIVGTMVCALEQGGEEVLECAETDGEGEYVVENLPEGDYSVEFIGDDCSSGTCEPKWAMKFFDNVLPYNPPTPVHVEEGDRTQEIDAELELNSSISGTVESASGPIPNTVVCVNSHTEYHPACAFTNDDGEYEVPDLPPGDFDVDFTGWVCEAGGSGCTQESCELGESCPRTYVEQYYGGRLNNEEASVTLSAGVPTSGIDATLVLGGRIEGTVTVAALGDPPLPGIIVCAFSDEAVNGSCGSTNAAGEYVIEGLAEAPFMVEFTEACPEEEPCPGTWVTQYYDGKAEEEEADAIQVTTGDATTGIDASMVPANPQRPALMTAPALAGDPSVGSTLSCSEGAWSNYPTAIAYAWQRNGATIAGQSGSTYVVTSSDERTSLTCAVTVSNGAGSASATSNTLVVFPRVEETKPAENNPPPPPSSPTPTPTPTPAPTPVPVKGQATAMGNATASGNTVTVSLKCNGQGACEGTLKLVYEAKVKNAKGKTTVKKVAIGSASFEIAVGKSKAIKVKLNSKGAAYLAEAGKQGLKVRLTGSGVKGRTLTIKRPALP
jgi:hypothetical protein